ncbi:MAG: hypothetical protein RLZZ472_17 [Pseudomonadota bacterium]|jgi:hypothetical protein
MMVTAMDTKRVPIAVGYPAYRCVEYGLLQPAVRDRQQQMASQLIRPRTRYSPLCTLQSR